MGHLNTTIADKFFQEMVKDGVLQDRMTYTLQDLQKTYPVLAVGDAVTLYFMIQKARTDSEK